MKNRNKINNALSSGYSVNVVDLIGQAWDIFKSGASYFIVLVLVSMLISFLCNFIPYIGDAAYSLFIGPIVGLGYAILAFKIRSKVPYELENAFEGIKKYGPIILAVLIRNSIFLILIIPVLGSLGFSLLIEQDYSRYIELEEIGPLFIITGIVIFYLFLSLRWAEMLIFFFGYNTLDGLKTSFLLVNKNIGVHLLLVICFILICMLGLIALFIGIFVAIPVCIILDYLVFEKITGLMIEDEEENSGFIFDKNEDYL